MKKGGSMDYHAYYLAEIINVEAYREAYSNDIISVSKDQVYYLYGSNKYLYVFSYGAVIMCNIDDAERRRIIGAMGKYVEQPLTTATLHDHFVVELDENEDIGVSFDKIYIGRFNDAVNKMIMLNLAQSVALDYFNTRSQELLEEVKKYTRVMQTRGRVILKQKRALRLLGESLDIKNQIHDNLYILDSPDITWEDEYIDELNRSFSSHLELGSRYRVIETTLGTVETNLDVFVNYNNHRESSRLEWVIIILIVIEVIETMLSKFGH